MDTIAFTDLQVGNFVFMDDQFVKIVYKTTNFSEEPVAFGYVGLNVGNPLPINCLWPPVGGRLRPIEITSSILQAMGFTKTPGENRFSFKDRTVYDSALSKEKYVHEFQNARSNLRIEIDLKKL
jgi:hypothetical protein